MVKFTNFRILKVMLKLPRFFYFFSANIISFKNEIWDLTLCGAESAEIKNFSMNSKKKKIMISMIVSSLHN